LDTHQIYHFAFNIPPQQFAEAKAWIAQRVPPLTDHTGADEFYFEAWNAHALYFSDPAGNIVELIARHTLASQSHQPFTEQSLLSVSEIGLVTDNVRDTVHLLRTRLGISSYQGTGNDEFTAVGDEAGLFIVVKRGRIWFPDTNKPAAVAPVSVTVAAGSTHATVAGPPYQVTLQ
jgi:catechol-2,3-dioxygenase